MCRCLVRAKASDPSGAVEMASPMGAWRDRVPYSTNASSDGYSKSC